MQKKRKKEKKNHQKRALRNKRVKQRILHRPLWAFWVGFSDGLLIKEDLSELCVQRGEERKGKKRANKNLRRQGKGEKTLN